MKRILMFALIALLLPITGFAADDPPPTNIQVNPGEAVLEVHGIVCSFCSVGVQKKLSKLPFIDTSKYTDGVHVEIKKQKVTVALKPGEQPDVKAMYESVKSGGYEPKKAYVAGKDGSVTTYDKEGSLCTASC